MSENPSIPPVVKKVLVPGGAEDTFALFTERIGHWWPRASHSVGGEDCAEVRLEGVEGGRLYEVTTNGTEHEWGRVTAWEPGRRLTLTWYPGLGAELATTVDLTFWPTTSGTEVRLVHDGWHALGGRADAARADYEAGWDVVLGHLPPGAAAVERVSETDLTHLRRCVELARTALEGGNGPFGSVLVGADGSVLGEDHNRESDGDPTLHPEIELARWAARNLTPQERQEATLYTSGEHCPMCAAAHAWAGLGRIVYAASSAQLTAWRREWGAPSGPVAPLPIQQVAPGVRVDGPAPQLEEELRALHERSVRAGA